MNLRDRYWEITVGTSRIASSDGIAGNRPLSVAFDISKSLDREPNRATVKVANLSKSRRESLELAESQQVSIVAGYRDQGLHDTIFVGDSRDVYSTREGPDIWTLVESEDGGTSYRTARLSASFEPGTSLATVIQSIARSMAVGIGNASSVAASATLESGASIFPNGFVVEGPAWRSLDSVCRSAGLRWSIQNGVLQLRTRRRPATTSSVLLSPSTGLVGSPQRGSKDPRTGDIKVTANALIVPGLTPGQLVRMESTTVTGDWMIHSVQYTGSTVENDWYASLTLKDYDAA